ncbi:MAG: hypothetical protein V3U19_02245 [Thermodesulfobacteriota bacterium]
MKKLILTLGLLLLILSVGCISQETLYDCSTGIKVNDPSLCPKITTPLPTTAIETAQTTTLTTESSSVASVRLKSMEVRACQEGEVIGDGNAIKQCIDNELINVQFCPFGVMGNSRDGMSCLSDPNK